jgi:L-2-hydroxyglutarate oxidase LhgO
MADHLDCVVVGAGVVGLAVARALALAGREVVVMESEPQIGMHTSSRNSEVIHAGIYFPQDSLKARFCVRGKELLYDFCESHQVDYKRIGKLIVAPSVGDLDRLNAIQLRAAKCGVQDLKLLSANELSKFEPDVVGNRGLFSPSTGIVDSHQLMVALMADIESKGGAVVCNSRVSDLQSCNRGLSFCSGSEEFRCKNLINSAGLWAQELASRLRPLLHSDSPPIHFAKAHYFSYQGKSPFNHLVYPLPVDGGLGIHATIDLSGAARFGPDISWIKSIDYSFDESRKPAFAAAIRSYFPGLDENKLTPAYTGIRPKLSGKGAQFTDFNIQLPADHGVPGLVNLYGIESPGLTASLAIAEYIQHNL